MRHAVRYRAKEGSPDLSDMKPMVQAPAIKPSR